MSRLALYLLGPPRLELDGEPVHIERRKALALLAYLAVARQRHGRDALATLLWPGFDQRGARAELRRALATLSRQLGSEWFATDRDTVGLDTDTDVWLDVDQFRQLLAACDAHGHPVTEACEECQALLEAAVELYGDDFMAGFSLPDSLAFEEWQRFESEGLRDELASALERLVGCHRAGGEYEPAIAYARRWLALDPTHETAHRELMALYAQAGRRGAALRQYRACMRILEGELGVPPAAETTALYERLRAKRPRPVERKVAPPGPPPELPPRFPAFLDPLRLRVEVPQEVFVARERELAQLDRHLEAALAGQGQVFFVTGGPGRGKTALMREFARRATETHPELLVASGSCNAFAGVGDPYLPFREVLAMLTGDVESRWAAGKLSTQHARRLWSALPKTVRALLDYGPHLIETLVPAVGLLSRAEAAAQPIGAETLQELQEWLELRRSSAGGVEQERIFQQVSDTLAALSSSNPLLLTLDDLQWTDTASASLLFHLGRQLAEVSGRVLILGAYRPEEVALDRAGERHPLQKVLSEFRRHFGDVWLDLARADEIEARAFVEAYLDSEPNRLGEDFRAALSDRTGGHPLFTIELLRAMQERGELLRDPDGAWRAGPALDWETLPVRVEAAIQERIERLDEEGRDLLTVASVEGEVFTAQAVAEVQGLSEREVLHTLFQELGPRGHRLVREAEDVALDGRYLSRYQFGHALFQAYLYAGLSAGERRLLHREIGDALEGLYGGQTDLIAAALAHHYQAAGHLEKAADYALRAGVLANEAYAYEQSADYFRSSLEFYRRLGNRAGEADSLVRLAWANNWLDRHYEQEMCFHEALRIYRELGDASGEASTLGNLGWLYVRQSDPVRAEKHLQRSATLFHEIGEPGKQANVVGGLGRLYREHMGDFERARACGEEARCLSREAGDLFNEAIGEFNVGFALHYQGDYSAAEPHMQASVKTMYENRDWLVHGALGRVGVGLNAVALGDYSTALAHLEGSRRTFRELRLEYHDDDAWAQSALALLYHQLGEDQTARDYAARALAIHRKTGYDYRTATALTRLGHALTALGELTEAAEVYQEALDLRRQMGQRHLAPEPLAGLARVALAQDDPARALTYVEEILSHLATRHIDGTDEPLRIYLTCYRVLSANKDARAEQVLEQAHDLLQERAAKIEDEELRRSFLENVAAHREIVDEYNSLQDQSQASGQGD